MALRAILFDLDGTLADTESPGHLPAYNRAFDELALPWRWSAGQYRKLLLIASGRERVSHFLHNNASRLREAKALHRCNTSELIDKIHTAKARHFSRLVEHGEVPLRIGVARLMRDALAANIVIAVVTNATHATLVPLLKHVLGDEFASRIRVFGGAHGGCRRKPSPDLYARALQRLDFHAHECIAIEDSAMGLEAALGASLTTLITVNRNTSDQQFPGACLVVSDLGEPGQPFTLLAGDNAGSEWVTVALLRQLCMAGERPGVN